jgi:preprotein translocase subunit SecF
MSLFTRLYQGETSFDVIGKRKRWYTFSAVVLLICIGSLLFRQFNLGVDFTGGAVFEFKPAVATTVSDVEETVVEAGIPGDPIVEKIGNGIGSYRVKTKALTGAQVDKVSAAIAKDYGVTADSINPTSVSPTWGKQITRKALVGLVVFLAAVILYISMRFEPKMAAASIAALVHDLIVTAGIYSIIGFEVTPSTVIAFLTILGYSLYDNIVVFDKVRENTVGLAGGNRMDYSEAANLSINQTIMRSVNTTLTSLLPVASLLFVGVIFLGAGSLKDLSLSLFVGMAAGAYSSVFFATPLLVDMKEREPQYKALKQRVLLRRNQLAAGTTRAMTPAKAAAAGGGGAVAVEEVPSKGAAPLRPSTGTNRPQPRPQKRKPAGKGGGKGKGGRPSGKKRR